MKTIFNGIIPVLPSADISRDVAWYQNQTGFEAKFADEKFAVLNRDNLYLHLQWHADTVSDRLPVGLIIRIDVQNIKPLFDEFVTRGTVKQGDLKTNTPWRTNEFIFYDLNKNVVVIMEGSD